MFLSQVSPLQNLETHSPLFGSQEFLIHFPHYFVMLKIKLKSPKLWLVPQVCLIVKKCNVFLLYMLIFERVFHPFIYSINISELLLCSTIVVCRDEQYCLSYPNLGHFFFVFYFYEDVTFASR